MIDPTLRERLGSLERRVGAIEEEQSNPDAITRIVKVYGRIRLTAILSASLYTFRVCSDTLSCSEELIL